MNCPRCSNGNGTICRPCAVEIAAKLTDPNDELVTVYYTGHGINHGSYRADIRLGAL